MAKIGIEDRRRKPDLDISPGGKYCNIVNRRYEVESFMDSGIPEAYVDQVTINEVNNSSGRLFFDTGFYVDGVTSVIYMKIFTRERRKG